MSWRITIHNRVLRVPREGGEITHRENALLLCSMISTIDRRARELLVHLQHYRTFGFLWHSRKKSFALSHVVAGFSRSETPLLLRTRGRYRGVEPGPVSSECQAVARAVQSTANTFYFRERETEQGSRITNMACAMECFKWASSDKSVRGFCCAMSMSLQPTELIISYVRVRKSCAGGACGSDKAHRRFFQFLLEQCTLSCHNQNRQRGLASTVRPQLSS